MPIVLYFNGLCFGFTQEVHLFIYYLQNTKSISEKGVYFFLSRVSGFVSIYLPYCQASWFKNNMIWAGQKGLCTGVYIFKK